jgi:AcrR family transcriptional regulator
VAADQRRRLIEAVPAVVAERGYEATSVAHLVKAAAVSRNAFYGNFTDKQACFEAAYEARHEWLLGVLRDRCDPKATPEERIEAALGRALEALSQEPDVARLLFVEALGAGNEVSLRHHEWLRRYGALLGTTAGGAGPFRDSRDLDRLVVGGVASLISGEVLNGNSAELRLLVPRLLEFSLGFYGLLEEASPTAPASQPERGVASLPANTPRRRAAS